MIEEKCCERNNVVADYGFSKRRSHSEEFNFTSYTIIIRTVGVIFKMDLESIIYVLIGGEKMPDVWFYGFT